MFSSGSGCPFARFASSPEVNTKPLPKPPASVSTGELPPGPRGLPIIGSFWEFFRNPLTFFQRLQRDYGDVARFKVGSQDYYQLNNPEYIRNFLVRDHAKVEKAGIIIKAKKVLGEGLLTVDGEDHKRQRRQAQPAFSGTSLLQYAKVITPFVQTVASRWESGAEIELTREMNKLTLGIAGRTLFGADLYDDTGELNQAVTDALEYFRPNLMMTFGLWDKLPTAKARKLKKAKKVLDEAVRKLIEKHMQSAGPAKSFIGMLIASMEQDGPLNEQKIRELHDQVMTFLLAGHETVGTALTWTFHLLSQNPEIQAKFLAEIDSVIGNASPRAEDMDKLVYTGMIINESLRLYPPLWALKRRIKEDYQVGRYTIPAGSLVGVSQYVTQRNPEFFPDPDKFNPDRWTPEETAKRPEYSYFPFGGGPRSCIGGSMAILEMKLVLAEIARVWRFKATSKEEIPVKPLITLRPGKEIRVTVIPRFPKTSQPTPAGRYDGVTAV